MKKTLLLSVIASTLMIAGGDIAPVEPVVETPDVEAAPVTDYAPALALIGGAMKFDKSGSDWKGFYGAELSFTCLLSNQVRQQIQVTNYDNDGIQMLQANINPHYMIDIAEGTQVGFGPTLGVARVEVGNDDDTIFTYGVGTSIRKNLTENVFVGAEAKYEWTTDVTIAGVDTDFNNAKVFAKLGYQF
jgi:opacity protein-like surface antigen